MHACTITGRHRTDTSYHNTILLMFRCRRVDGGSDLTFRNVSVSFGEKSVLRGVSGSVRPGQMVALFGPSGASSGEGRGRAGNRAGQGGWARTRGNDGERQGGAGSNRGNQLGRHHIGLGADPRDGTSEAASVDSKGEDSQSKLHC